MMKGAFRAQRDTSFRINARADVAERLTLRPLRENSITRRRWGEWSVREGERDARARLMNQVALARHGGHQSTTPTSSRLDF